MKIALVGMCPDHWHLAPFKDPAWEIWGGCHRAQGKLPRCDVWVEIHDFKAGRRRWQGHYFEWMKTQNRVITQENYPFQEIIDEFGPWFLTSTCAWMLALAITKKPEAIGLWGFEMRLGGEHQKQRPGAHHFLWIAKTRGIQIVLPAGCKLMKPEPLYGGWPKWDAANTGDRDAA